MQVQNIREELQAAQIKLNYVNVVPRVMQIKTD